MAQSGFTPILTYASGTAASVPLAANLTSGVSGAELAINYADGKLFYKDGGGVVQVIANKNSVNATVSSVAVSGGTTGLTTSGGPITTSGTITLAGTLGVPNGGTGLTSINTNYIPYGTGTSALSLSASLQFDSSTLRVGAGALLGALTNPIIAATGSVNNYIQNYVYNSTNGSAASSDFVAYANNSTDAAGWADFGYTSSTYSDATYSVTGPNEAYLFGSALNNTFTGNLVYATSGTGSANAHQWYVGGFNQAKGAWKMQLNASGLQLANALPVTSGGTGTTTPSIVAGSNITVTGTWPNQTINSTGGTIVQAITTATTITPTPATSTQYEVTALATPATIATPAGSPSDGQKLVLRIKDNGTAQALTWTVTSGAYRAVGCVLPTTTVVSKVVYIGLIYNSQDSFWDAVSVAQL